MQRAVVTGGAGFIGSHVVELLLREGFEVHVVDNLSTGRRANVEAAVANAKGSDGLGAVHFHHVDVNDGDALTEACADATYLFHFAALADIVPSIEKPLAYHRANVDGTAQVLEVARRLPDLRKFVYAASSSCYGIPDQLPTTETAPPLPQYPYALTKYIAEQYVLHWSQVYGLPSVSLRMFNVYGPRARTGGTYGAVFGVFLAQRLAGRPMTVVGDGTQTRDFIYVSDVADAFVRAARSDVSGQVFNVGASSPQSINHLCALIGGPTEHLPKRPGEPDCTWADTTKIRNALDWRPAVSFEEGTARMLATIEDWREAPVWTKEKIAVATADWFDCLGSSKERLAAQPPAKVHHAS